MALQGAAAAKSAFKIVKTDELRSVSKCDFTAARQLLCALLSDSARRQLFGDHKRMMLSMMSSWPYLQRAATAAAGCRRAGRGGTLRPTAAPTRRRPPPRPPGRSPQTLPRGPPCRTAPAQQHFDAVCTLQRVDRCPTTAAHSTQDLTLPSRLYEDNRLVSDLLAVRPIKRAREMCARRACAVGMQQMHLQGFCSFDWDRFRGGRSKKAPTWER